MASNEEKQEHIVYVWKGNSLASGECTEVRDEGLWRRLTDERSTIVGQLEDACSHISDVTDLGRLASMCDRLLELNVLLGYFHDTSQDEAVRAAQRRLEGIVVTEDHRRANEANARRDRARRHGDKLVSDCLLFGELLGRLGGSHDDLAGRAPLDLDRLEGDSTGSLLRDIEWWRKRMAKLEQARDAIARAPKDVRTSAQDALDVLIGDTRALLDRAIEIVKRRESAASEERERQAREAVTMGELLARIEALELGE